MNALEAYKQATPAGYFDPTTAERNLQIFHQVCQGMSYDRVAKPHGISHQNARIITQKVARRLGFNWRHDIDGKPIFRTADVRAWYAENRGEIEGAA